MEVNVKKFDVAMQVKNKGIEFDVYDGEEFLGDFIVSKSGITWCKGKTSRAKGKKVYWKKLIKLLEEI
ncbi:MAG: hypothetical protein U0942_13365 [Parvibaculum sp.]|uniref:hypothetical protein n=1 Tax=Parvibaculum sp. TaxID=2024848 RepID=UPI000CB9CA1A|nr:hypothetical protein [Parvibaculum sp.]MDZ4382319.1 hypothetical protein [Parvibaculum sp.]PKP76362.1 MAG: hypothetical protein CVT81_15175 [Alphaproteobacteria bacterium HGW-Alphaproteobacteria-3]